MSREQVLLNSAIIFVNPIWCYQGVLLRQAGVYCIGSERDELIVDTIGRMYMDALTVVPATKSWRRTCHVKHHIHALAISGRQWQGAVDGWSREESMEFLQPALTSRKDFFHARRLRMQRKKHELPESLRAKAQQVTHAGLVQRAHATRELLTSSKNKILMSTTHINNKLKKWQESDDGRAWKAVRDKMFQADDPDASSDT